MKVIIAYNADVAEWYKNKHPECVVETFYSHPKDTENLVKTFVDENFNKNIEVMTFNSLALDFMPKQTMVYVGADYKVYNFESYFEDKLGYMYPGEVFLNLE